MAQNETISQSFVRDNGWNYDSLRKRFFAEISVRPKNSKTPMKLHAFIDALRAWKLCRASQVQWHYISSHRDLFLSLIQHEISFNAHCTLHDCYLVVSKSFSVEKELCDLWKYFCRNIWFGSKIWKSIALMERIEPIIKI